jgi:prefoldin subunit 5
MEAVSINSEDYNKMTKAELIKVIENIKEQIEYYNEIEEDYDEQLEKLKSENEHYSRSINNYEQKEKEEDIYRQPPHMKPLWMRKGFDF